MWKKFSFVLALTLVSGTAMAQATSPGPTRAEVRAEAAAVPAPGKPGSIAAELGGAALGDAVGTVLTGFVVIKWADACFSDCNGNSDDTRALSTLSYLPRPVLVGGGASLFGQLRGGEGRPGVAMLGALPGSVLLALSLQLFDSSAPGPLVVGSFLLGHAATIGGSVWAYRHSARQNPRIRSTEPLARMTPGFFADAKQRSGGLTLSGTF